VSVFVTFCFLNSKPNRIFKGRKISRRFFVFFPADATRVRRKVKDSCLKEMKVFCKKRRKEDGENLSKVRYHGAFVPPSSKSNSLIDVPPEYDDMKWPSKYVDSNAFFIKDVPPKKRALPLIPANKSSNYRYQPPEFD